MNGKHPRARTSYLLLGMTLLGAAAFARPALAQTTPTAAPAFGQEPAATPPAQAPPVTSLDEPSLEPGVAARSYLQPGAHLTETVNSNLRSQSGLGGSGLIGITRVLGSLDMKRLWSRYDLNLNYIGGLSLYSDAWGQPTQTHSLDASQRYSWRTGNVSVCDSMSYLPEGSFGYSGSSGGGSCGGSSSGGGGSSFGSVSNTDPRLSNSTAINAQESLNPRSTVTFGGGYSFTDFLHTTSVATVNSHGVNAQAGYNRVLSRFDQIGVSYGFQQFQFPTQGAGTIVSNVVQALYAHQISGRMSLILGAGPQFTSVGVRMLANNPPSPAFSTVNLNVRASLKYRFPRTALEMSYARYTSSGSGLQLGSESDVIRGGIQRPLNRIWSANFDAGYSHHVALQAAAGRALGGSFQDGFTGGGVTRHLGRFFSLAMHYQYAYEYFSSTACKGGLIDCSHSFNRHIADVTLSWHPLPIRLD